MRRVSDESTTAPEYSRFDCGLVLVGPGVGGGLDGMRERDEAASCLFISGCLFVPWLVRIFDCELFNRTRGVFCGGELESEEDMVKACPQ